MPRTTAHGIILANNRGRYQKEQIALFVALVRGLKHVNEVFPTTCVCPESKNWFLMLLNPNSLAQYKTKRAIHSNERSSFDFINVCGHSTMMARILGQKMLVWIAEGHCCTVCRAQLPKALNVHRKRAAEMFDSLVYV